MLRHRLAQTFLLAGFTSLSACSTFAGFETISGQPIEEEVIDPGGPPLIWQRVSVPLPGAGPACGPAGIVMSEGTVYLGGTYLGPCDLGGGVLPYEADPHYHAFLANYDAVSGDYVTSVSSDSEGVHQIVNSLGLTNDSIVLGGMFTGLSGIGGCAYDAGTDPMTHFVMSFSKTLGCAAMSPIKLDGGAVATATRIGTNGDGIFAGMTSSADVTRGSLRRIFASTWIQNWLPPKDSQDPPQFTAPPTINLSSTTARSEVVVTAGDFLGNMVVNGVVHSASTAADAFLFAAREADGAFQWFTTFTGTGEQNIFDTEQTFVDGVNELYVTGGFDTQIVIGAETFISSGGRDAYIARMDPLTGTVKQAFAFGDGSDQNGHALAFDPVSKRVILIGGFRGQIQFQNALVENNELEDHLYMMIFNTELKLLSLTTYGKGGKQVIRSAYAADSNLFLTGVFFGELDLGNPATKMVNDTGSQAMFWARIGL